MINEEEVLEHQSFGVVSFSRVNGNSGYLFGSEIKPNNFIELSISRAKEFRNLTNKHYYDDNELIRVKMSPTQFSELITTLNCGVGTPCTIESINGKEVEQVKDVENRKTFVNRKFKERINAVSDRITDNVEKAKKLIAKKNLSKSDQHELRMIIESSLCEVRNNIPFFVQCFQESMNEIVVDAKAEIDASIQHIVTQTGMKAIAEQFNEFKKISQ